MYVVFLFPSRLQLALMRGVPRLSPGLKAHIYFLTAGQSCASIADHAVGDDVVLAISSGASHRCDVCHQ